MAISVRSSLPPVMLSDKVFLALTQQLKECATCHLYLSSSPAPPVSEPSEAEDDMLGYAIGYKEGESRLGCQIEVTKDLAKWCDEGGIIRLPRF